MAHGSVDTQFVLFPAGPADAEALGRVHVLAWRETYRGLLPDAYLAGLSEVRQARRFAQALLEPAPDQVTLAAADRRGVVGYAQGGRSRRGALREAEVATLYLLKSAQGRGVGARLLIETARALAARGASSLIISVLRDNLAARGFYERLGGVAEPPRLEPAPGGGFLHEITYRWTDLQALTR